jgi:hypothetical protein
MLICLNFGRFLSKRQANVHLPVRGDWDYGPEMPGSHQHTFFFDGGHSLMTRGTSSDDEICPWSHAATTAMRSVGLRLDPVEDAADGGITADASWRRAPSPPPRRTSHRAGR